MVFCGLFTVFRRRTERKKKKKNTAFSFRRKSEPASECVSEWVNTTSKNEWEEEEEERVNKKTSDYRTFSFTTTTTTTTTAAKMLKRFKRHAKDKLHVGERNVTFNESEMPSKASPSGGINVLIEDKTDRHKKDAASKGETPPRALHHTWPSVFSSGGGKRRSVSLIMF